MLARGAAGRRLLTTRSRRSPAPASRLGVAKLQPASTEASPLVVIETAPDAVPHAMREREGEALVTDGAILTHRSSDVLGLGAQDVLAGERPSLEIGACCPRPPSGAGGLQSDTGDREIEVGCEVSDGACAHPAVFPMSEVSKHGVAHRRMRGIGAPDLGSVHHPGADCGLAHHRVG